MKAKLNVKLIEPFKNKNFSILWMGMMFSLIGDGVYSVAIVWTVYDISNLPTALSVASIAWTIPELLFLLIGGVLSDRFERKKIMIIADIIRGICVFMIGLFYYFNILTLTNLIIIVAIYAIGKALFGPAVDSLIPDLISKEKLFAANSLNQLARPIALRLIGPVFGGWLIAVTHPSSTFFFNSFTFVISTVVLLIIKNVLPLKKHVYATKRQAFTSLFSEIGQGIKYVYNLKWLYFGIILNAVILLVYWGPYQVLIPYIIKNNLQGTAGDLSLVYAFGGAGAMIGALLIGQKEQINKPLKLVIWSWGLGTLTTAGYALSNNIWTLNLIALISNILFTIGNIVFFSTLQIKVNRSLLGRANSILRLSQSILIPISFALTGLVSVFLDSSVILFYGGIIGGVFSFLFLFSKNLKDEKLNEEKDESLPS